MRFINPVVSSIFFEPDRSFSGAFITFVNHWWLKKDKNVFKLAFKCRAFSEITEMLETDAHKKHNFQYYCENKMSQIIVFWSNCEIKMPQNVVFKLNREIRKLFKKFAKSRCRENFMQQKFLTLKLPMSLSPNVSSKTSPTPPLAPSFYEGKWKKHQDSIEVIGWVYSLLILKVSKVLHQKLNTIIPSSHTVGEPQIFFPDLQTYSFITTPISYTMKTFF